MSSRKLRELSVLKKYDLTPNMLRIVLTGDDLKDFPEGQESGYIKLLFVSDNPKPILRTYTIRYFDLKKRELTLDFVVHGVNTDPLVDDEQFGPAISWANNVEIGETITIDGPGPTKLVDPNGEWFFFAGDMTAMPAISANLESLPENSKGHAVLEILTESDKYPVNAPKGIELHWVINSEPDKANTILLDAVSNIEWLEGSPHVWVASEFDAMRSLRKYFKSTFAEKGLSVERGQIYASSYWKAGETDEGNKAAKKRDNAEVA